MTKIQKNVINNENYIALAADGPSDPAIPPRYHGWEVTVYRDGFHAGYREAIVRAALVEPESIEDRIAKAKAATEASMERIRKIAATPARQLAAERRAALAEPEPEGPTEQEWDALVESAWDKYKTVGYQGERFIYERDFETALGFVREELARWGNHPGSPDSSGNLKAGLTGSPVYGEVVELAETLERMPVGHIELADRLIKAVVSWSATAAGGGGGVMTYPLTTTLNRIWALDPCDEGKARALDAAGKTAPDDELITFAQIVEAVGLQDALWCCRAEPQHGHEWRLFAVWCARQVQHLMTDPRSVEALNVAEKYAAGEATDNHLAAAWDAAWDAARAAAGAGAGGAACAAACAAARAAARAAAWDAAWDAARAAAGDAACAAACAAAWEAQKAAFLQLVTTGTLPPVRQEMTP